MLDDISIGEITGPVKEAFELKDEKRQNLIPVFYRTKSLDVNIKNRFFKCI